MANTNASLQKAKNEKNDEFYTCFEDVEIEMQYYKTHFKDKIVLCNCNDTEKSVFWKYFYLNFAILGLKKIIAISYNKEGIAYKLEYTGNNGIYVKTQLESNGDYNSNECLELLNECDIVVTNPPFSLFNNFVKCLIQHQKKFIILGNMNALTYKDIFPLFKNNVLWYGASIHSGDRKFYVPNNYSLRASGCGIDINGQKFIRVKGVRWFTNLNYDERYYKLLLTENFTSEKYLKYDNYPAWNVNRTCEIPKDDYIEVEINEQELEVYKAIYTDLEVIDE